MSASPYSYQHYLLRSLATQLRLPPGRQLAAEPGVQAVIRITCHHPTPNTPDSVATLLRRSTSGATLTVIYADGTQPPSIAIDAEAFQAFTAQLSAIKFDRMDDQPGIPAHGVPLWLVERAAGSFEKAVLLCPPLAQNEHQTLIYRIHEYLPQSVEFQGM